MRTQEPSGLLAIHQLCYASLIILSDTAEIVSSQTESAGSGSSYSFHALFFPTTGRICLASMPLMTHRPKQAQSALYCKVLPIHHLHVGQSSMQHGFNISRIKGCDLYTSAERDCSAIMYNMVHNFVLGPASQAEASRGLTSQTACEPEIRGACQKGMAEMNLFPDVPVKCSSGSSALSSPLWCMHQGLPMLSHPPSADVLSRRPVLSCWPGGEGTHCPVALQS